MKKKGNVINVYEVMIRTKLIVNYFIIIQFIINFTLKLK
jgi:hypothetical protein